MAQGGCRSGLSAHPLYPTWSGMVQRCDNPRSSHYGDYGGRGIKVCERWHDPAVFLADIEAEIGSRPAGMSLDRWPDNDGDYAPGNVRWATPSQQMLNRRGWKGKVSAEDRALLLELRHDPELLHAAVAAIRLMRDGGYILVPPDAAF